jgi:phage terminase small subunit
VLVKATRGEDIVKKHPALQIVQDQAQLVASIGGRFGLSPSDRESLSMPRADDDLAARIFD